ncbi:MAG: Gfo/Idh/MocA family oxidoreductase [Ruminococcaceae bacterium]|nr:Gfo/Idh/MocA family oxidoreductase [Oscillospiraceae bacterium]
MKNINIAVLGTGFMGKTHTYSIKNLPFYYNMDFVPVLHTVYTRREEAAKEFCETFGFKKYTTCLDDVVNDPEIDVIDICTPNCCHYETLVKAINAGKHILCEKPVVTNMEEAREIEKLLDKHPELVHRVVFNNRHLPAVMRARQLADEGRLGRILTFRSEYLHSSVLNLQKNAAWKQTAESGGGVLFDIGSHAIDLFLFITASDKTCKPKKIFGKSQIAYPVRKGRDGGEWRTDADEAFYMLCELENGAVGSFEGSKIAQGTNDELSIEIRGEKGALKFSLMDPNYLYFYDATKPEAAFGGERGYTAIECVGRYVEPATTFPSVKAPVGWLRGHVQNMYTYLSDVSHGIQSVPSIYHGLYINRIMDAALNSDKSGKWEDIND